MKNISKRWLIPALFTAAGALAGLVYYRLFGCSSGCLITSSPVGTMLYMALIGWLLSRLFTGEKGE